MSIGGRLVTGKNVFFAHSGGVTAVLNNIAHAVITSAEKTPGMAKVYIGENGILGAINERLIDTSAWSKSMLDALCYTPASAFGSCRYKLANAEDNEQDYRRIFEVFAAHNIGYFFYNGGNDSQDTTNKIFQYSQKIGYPLVCIGIPKTIDNDLPHTDTCPGFGSAAKYVATATLEAGLDVKAMSATSTQVFILEVMGRHAGWLTAATGLAQRHAHDAPHIILLPERLFSAEKFLEKVRKTIDKNGFCVITAAEGLCLSNGQLLTKTALSDAFGHPQLGGLAPQLANIITQHAQLKVHWAVADYLQRSAGHLLSATDVAQAKALGEAAVCAASQGKNGLMMTIKRTSNAPYKWETSQISLSEVANIERTLPDSFISQDGMHITSACKTHLRPYIMGECAPPYRNGIPDYPLFDKRLVTPRCHALVANE